MFRAARHGHVADCGGDEQSPRGAEPAEADLGGKLGAVAPASPELKADAHRSRGGMRHVPRPQCRVPRGETFGHEALDGLADQLGARPTEDPLRLVVHEDDLAGFAHCHERIGRGGEQPSQHIL